MTNYRNRHDEWVRSSKQKDVEDESNIVPEEASDTEVDRLSRRRIQRLRETLTEGMAFRAFKCEKGRSPREGELEPFMEKLIRYAYHCGYDEWDDDLLYSN